MQSQNAVTAHLSSEELLLLALQITTLQPIKHGTFTQSCFNIETALGECPVFAGSAHCVLQKMCTSTNWLYRARRSASASAACVALAAYQYMPSGEHCLSRPRLALRSSITGPAKQGNATVIAVICTHCLLSFIVIM